MPGHEEFVPLSGLTYFVLTTLATFKLQYSCVAYAKANRRINSTWEAITKVECNSFLSQDSLILAYSIIILLLVFVFFAKTGMTSCIMIILGMYIIFIQLKSF